MGVISALAGGFLLVNPEMSLGVLVVVICVWLFAVRVHRDRGRVRAAWSGTPY